MRRGPDAVRLETLGPPGSAAFLRWKCGVTTMSNFAHRSNTAVSPSICRCPGEARFSRSRGGRALALVLALAGVILSGGAVHGQRSGGHAKRHAPQAPAWQPEPIDAELRTLIKNAPKAAQYPNSNAVCLRDTCEVFVLEDGSRLAQYHRTFKLFNERARDLAEVTLPYDMAYQDVSVLYARTIQKSGRVLSVRPTEIRALTNFADYPLYSDAAYSSFSLPGIEDDCVIDYAWNVVSDPPLPGHLWDRWTFTAGYPILKSRYTLHPPENRAWQYHTDNATLKPIIETDEDGLKTYTWKMLNVPPQEPEPLMPSPTETKITLRVTTLPTWQAVADSFARLMRPQCAADDAIRSQVARLTAGKTADAEKAAAIFDWVTDHVRSIAVAFGESDYAPHPAKVVYQKLYGDAKDKVALLIAMLGAAGIRAYPALVDKNTNYALRNRTPGFDYFDHCLAVADVDGRKVWLDPSQTVCAYGDIPFIDRGADALIVREKTAEFATVPPFTPDESRTEVAIKARLQPDGGADMHYELRMSGVMGQIMRGLTQRMRPEQRQQMAQGLAQMLSAGATLKDYTLTDSKQRADPFVIATDLTAPNLAKRSGSLLLLPLLFIYASGNTQYSPFLKEKRFWPLVMLHPIVGRAECALTLPDGYTLTDAPADTQAAGSLLAMRQRIVPAPDGRSLTVYLELGIKAGRLLPEEYGKERTVYDAILNAQREQIALRKTGAAGGGQ
jgi:hypothetical protein